MTMSLKSKKLYPMKTTYALALLAVIAMTGCSTAPRPGNYECELHDDAASKCASMQKAYNTSQGLTSAEAAGSQTVFEAKSSRGAGTVAAGTGVPIVGAQASGYPDVGEGGAPVFKQPKVMRVWVAPYVDADGNLRSGEYTYFSTPGQWNYGDLKKPGAAVSGMFAPARDSNLGFNPAATPKTNPAKPAEPAKVELPATVGASAPSQAAAPGAATPGVAPLITQPYQRLTGN
jgi:conjugal transfer pilus assembly protein TraV